MAISTVLAVIASLALFILWLTAVTNLFFFPRLAEGKPGTTPLVSILIPARNEGPTIGQTIASLRRQSYTDFELLVLDDESDDDTAAQVRRAAGDDGRCRLLSGQPLPAGWLGKNWACHQLAQAARGDYLLFSDADVHWRPEALDGLLALAEREQSDLLTIWPTQQTVTWSERLVVPLMALAILAYLPVLPVHHTRWRAFAAANGQCLLFRRAAYDRSGGHAAVRDDIVEDVTLARRVKAASGRLRMADGGGLISCRMYDGWPAVRDGFAKNILSGHGGPLLLLLSTLFHWLIFLWPWLWLAVGGGWWAVGLMAAGVGLRAVTAAFTRQRPLDALFMPLSVSLMTLIAFRSIWWQWHGQRRWKGRITAV
jgi:chlorobactene glucosyltransferase